MEYKVQKYKVRLVRDGAARPVRARFTDGRPGIVSCSEVAAEIFGSVLRALPHEEVWIALLGAQNDARGLVRVSQGGAHGAALRPVDLLRVVIASGSDAFVMAHNHPSGDPTPSAADLSMTQVLAKACSVVGVSIHDHIIWTERGGFRSLREGDYDIDW